MKIQYIARFSYEGTILVNGDLDRDDLAHLVLRLGIVCLAEIHDVHAVGSPHHGKPSAHSSLWHAIWLIIHRKELIAITLSALFS